LIVEITILVSEQRKKQNMTIRKLAELSGVSTGYISEVERGEKKPTIEVLCKLAVALGVKPEELYTYEYVE
jgi:transcriptional regulator with XRE-family HTH domain